MTRALILGVAGVLGCAALAWPQRPAASEATALIEQSRKKALEYGRTLPDFVCTETVQRLYDRLRRGSWQTNDKLTVKLSYFDQTESHKLTLLNDRPTDKTYETLDGAVGVGEFGGTLHSIFDPESAASFQWQSWKTVRKHRVAVYSYVVEQARSKYVLMSGTREHLVRGIVGFHGIVEVDGETAEVLHFTYEADHIPLALQLDYVLTEVDYELADVGGREYLLPARSDTEMHGPKMWMRNQMQFRQYGKFSTESTITFDGGK